MKILLTGVTGYIAQRLLPVLLENGHEVICCVRDKNRFNNKFDILSNVKVIEADFLKKETLLNIPNDIDVAFISYILCQLKSGILRIWKRYVLQILRIA